MTKRRATGLWRVHESGRARLLGLFLLLTGSPGICTLAWGRPGLRLGLIAQVVLLLVGVVRWADRTYGGSL